MSESALGNMRRAEDQHGNKGAVIEKTVCILTVLTTVHCVRKEMSNAC